MTYERIFVGLFALFAIGLVLLDPSLTGLATIGPMPLQDKVNAFFGVVQFSFLDSNNLHCQNAVEAILTDSLSVEPHKIRALSFDDKEGFGIYAYSSDYLTGELKLAKGASFIESNKTAPATLSLKSDEYVFGRYSNKPQAISVEINVAGEIAENKFYVYSGNIKTDSVNCEFKVR